MFVPFITIVPGMIAAVMVAEMVDLKAGGSPAGGASGEGVAYNDALLFMMRDLLPNGLLGLAITGLLAAFMAGMAANISAFNTVLSYDLWQDYIVKDRSDDYYLRVGRIATVAATAIAIGTASIAGQFTNIMDYLQTLFGFFNAPLFATFILGMFWKRMTPTAGWMGLVAGHAVRHRRVGGQRVGAPRPARTGCGLPGRLRRLRRGRRAQHRGLAGHHAQTGRPAGRAGVLRDAEGPAHGPVGAHLPWYRRTLPLAGLALAMVIVLNAAF